ncbi:MAG: DMT family transporter [Chloroflexota bacterium]
MAEVEGRQAGGLASVEALPEVSTAGGDHAGMRPAVQGFTVYDAMLLGMVVTWAANPAALKWGLQFMEPLAFNALRFLLATLVPVGIVLARREGFGLHRGDGPKLLLLGLVGHGFYQAVFILAVNLTLAGNVALILSINPAFVAVFSALFGFERIRAYAWSGVVLTLAGVGLVVLGSGKPFEFGSQLLGDVLMVVVTMTWALYTVFSQRLLRRYAPVQLNALTMPVGSVALLIVAGPSLASTAPTLPGLPPLFWVVLAGSGLLAVSASYIIWYKGLQKLGATRTAVYSNLVPVLAAVISFFVLGEPLGWQFWTGMALVLAGVSLTRFGGRLALFQSKESVR